MRHKALHRPANTSGIFFFSVPTMQVQVPKRWLAGASRCLLPLESQQRGLLREAVVGGPSRPASCRARSSLVIQLELMPRRRDTIAMSTRPLLRHKDTWGIRMIPANHGSFAIHSLAPVVTGEIADTFTWRCCVIQRRIIAWDQDVNVVIIYVYRLQSVNSVFSTTLEHSEPPALLPPWQTDASQLPVQRSSD